MANDKLITVSVIGINGNPITATTYGIPASQMVAETVTLTAPFASAVTKVTDLRTGTIYYSTTAVSAMVTSDGTANNLLTPSGAAISVIGKNGTAYPAARNTLFPSMGVIVNVVSFPEFLPSGASNPLFTAVSEITVLANGDVYYTAATTASIITASGTD